MEATSRRTVGVTAAAVVLSAVAAIVGLSWATSASAAEDPALTSTFEAMPNQTYALCAGAKSFNFNGVTYAKCRLKNGNSITLSHDFPGGDVLTVNKQLTDTGGFMVSTYSPPSPKLYATYTCSRNGAFAQCDGGLCYRYDGDFPGLGKVRANEVICSCPIVYKKAVYHVTGPATCPTTRQEYDSICGSGSRKDMTADGAILHIGSGGPAAVQHEVQNRLYDQAFGTQTPAPPTCSRPAQ